MLTRRYWPGDEVKDHLEFALRYEGLDLALLRALFRHLPAAVVEAWVKDQPTGQYARRVWFLHEWLTGERLDLPDAAAGVYADVLDPQRYYVVRGETSSRHRVRNNLPGGPDFCPLVRRTDRLQALLGGDLAEEARAVVRRTAPDLMARAAFLLLADSKASYVIEGERPPQNRIQR